MLLRTLPDVLPDDFHVRDARLAGVTRSRLTARDLAKPFHGVRSRTLAKGECEADLSAEERLVQRARQYSQRMGESEFFSHATAAVLWALPLPASAVPKRVVDVAVMAPGRLTRAAGARGHQVRPDRAAVRVEPASGLRVASPASTWAMLAPVLTHPYDVVAAGEALISDRRFSSGGVTLASIDQLDAVIDAGRRVGVGVLREARERIRPHVASRTETWTRLSLVDDGLPEPEVSWTVFGADGRKIACVDLAYPAAKIAIEYEGSHHRLDEAQWLYDIERYEALTEAGWLVIRVTKDELFNRPAALCARVRRALVARG